MIEPYFDSCLGCKYYFEAHVCSLYSSLYWRCLTNKRVGYNDKAALMKTEDQTMERGE